jgi:hypothetical protein
MEGAAMQTTHKRSTGLIVGAVIVALFGALALAIGGTAIWADATQRDDNGYVSTNTHRYSSATRAIATDGVTIGSEVPGWLVGKVRLEASSSKPMFVGIARKSAVGAYLKGTSYASATKLDLDPFKVTYVPHAGKANPGRPGDQSFWAASATWTGTRALTWKVKSGEWSVVLMNADGSPGVSADVNAGAKIPWALWAGIGLVVFGALVLALAALMGYRGSDRGGAQAQAAASVA